MKLVSFRIQNYCSIKDSGEIKVEQITAFVGRNESGKSNLLRALSSLNPPGGRKPLDKSDFPRNEIYKEDAPIVSTIWELEDDDIEAAGFYNFPRTEIKNFYIGRDHKGNLSSNFLLPALDSDEKTRIEEEHKTLENSSKNILDNLRVISALNIGNYDFDNAVSQAILYIQRFLHGHRNIIIEIKEPLSKIEYFINKNKGLYPKIEDIFIILVEYYNTILIIHNYNRNALLERIHKFIYIDKYPELIGSQNITEILSRKKKNSPTEEDIAFEKMCRIAGLDLEELIELYSQNEVRDRRKKLGKAGEIITEKIQKHWSNNKLKIVFEIDGEKFQSFVSDSSGSEDIVLDERSQGFRWFFAFYMSSLAETDIDAETGIKTAFLLDEPGLALHGSAQRDLLTHFEQDLGGNQILYTTHSPFMIPTDRLTSVRTVNITEDGHTEVHNNTEGDPTTMLPLQVALGYDLAQNLFIKKDNLVVEGVGDILALSAMSNYLNKNGNYGLADHIAVTSAGGAPKIPYMVNMLTGQNLKVVILLDRERDAEKTAKELRNIEGIEEQDIIFISDVLDASELKDADIEDLVDPDIYNALVEEIHKDELEGRSRRPVPPENLPRIAIRCEQEFKQSGIPFRKTDIMRLFYEKMRNNPEEVLTDGTKEHFKKLFRLINARFSEDKPPEAAD